MQGCSRQVNDARGKAIGPLCRGRLDVFVDVRPCRQEDRRCELLGTWTGRKHGPRNGTGAGARARTRGARGGSKGGRRRWTSPGRIPKLRTPGKGLPGARGPPTWTPGGWQARGGQHPWPASQPAYREAHVSTQAPLPPFFAGDRQASMRSRSKPVIHSSGTLLSLPWEGHPSPERVSRGVQAQPPHPPARDPQGGYSLPVLRRASAQTASNIHELRALAPACSARTSRTQAP